MYSQKLNPPLLPLVPLPPPRVSFVWCVGGWPWSGGGVVVHMDRFYDDMAEVDDDAEEDYDDKDRANANELTAMERSVRPSVPVCAPRPPFLCRRIYCSIVSLYFF